MKREWKLVADKKSPIGAWQLEAATCPRWPHEDALGSKRSTCLVGLTTNGQGAVPISWCKFASHDLGDDSTVECSAPLSPDTREG